MLFFLNGAGFHPNTQLSQELQRGVLQDRPLLQLCEETSVCLQKLRQHLSPSNSLSKGCRYTDGLALCRRAVVGQSNLGVAGSERSGNGLFLKSLVN